MASPTTTTAPPRPKLVPTTVAAAHTGLAKYRLRDLTRRGMPCVHVGRKLMYDLDAVDAWIARNLGTGGTDIAPPTAPAGTAQPSDDLDEHVRALVDQFPPLTPAQVDRIAGMLRSGGASDTAKGAA